MEPLGNTFALVASLLAGACLCMVVLRLLSIRAPAVEARRSAYLQARYVLALNRSPALRLATVLLPVTVPLAHLLPEPLRRRFHIAAERAGWPGGLEADELVALGLLLGGTLTLLLAAFMVMVFGAPAAVLGLGGVVLGPLAVLAFVLRMGDDRHRSVRRALPYVLDLLVLSTRSGASVLLALQRVATDFSGEAIGQEFERTLCEMEFGLNRSAAMDGLRRRLPVPQIGQFVDTLQQSEELGTPIADALERLADKLRAERVQDAETTAGRASVLVLIPSTLVFAAVILLLFSPFIIRWFNGDYQM
jgi:tight adherence protein C